MLQIFLQHVAEKLRIDEDFVYSEFLKDDYGILEENQDGVFRIVKSISSRASEYIKKRWWNCYISTNQFDIYFFLRNFHSSVSSKE